MKPVPNSAQLESTYYYQVTCSSLQ